MYLLACVFLLFFTAVQVSRPFGKMLMSPAELDVRGLFEAWIYAPLALFASAPVLALFYDASRMQSEGGIHPGNGQGTVWISLGGACLFFAVLTYQRWINGKRGRPLGFWGLGGFGACTLACLLIGTSTIKQLSFVDSHTGTIGFSLFENDVTDMKCDASILLAKIDAQSKGPIDYRCPTLFVLNPYSTTPFVPWPDYTEGTSKQLSVLLYEAMESAEKGPEVGQQ